MSRSVLQNEAATNPRDNYRIGFQGFLAKYPESKGYSFEFEARPDGDNGVRAVIRVVYPDGHATPLGNIALESVPIIKQHLHETGALKILYEGIKADTLAELERVRISLGVEPLLSRAEETVVKLQEILYRGPREWNSDTLEAIGTLMSNAGLVPPEQL